MLCHNSHFALWSIFFNSIPHNDACIKASKLSKFNVSHKWLSVLFSKSTFTNYNTWGNMLAPNDKHFLRKFYEIWPIGIRLIDAPAKLPCLLQYYFFTFMPQRFYKLKQLGSTCIVVNRCKSKFYYEALQLLLIHRYTKFFITWIIFSIENLWCIENM